MNKEDKKDKKDKKDKVIDVKETFHSFIEDTMPEMTQEEAIKNYQSNDTINIRYKKKQSEDDSDETEDEAHLRRLKTELLASLERVNKLAKQLFGEKEYVTNLKVKQKNVKYKGKEKVIEEMKQKVQDEKLQEGIERSREE